MQKSYQSNAQIQRILITKLTTEKEGEGITSVLQDSGLSTPFETFVLYLKFRLRFKVSAKYPLPRKAANR